MFQMRRYADCYRTIMVCHRNMPKVCPYVMIRYLWLALDEELLEDFGGAEGPEGRIVEAVVGEDGVEHLVALLAVETENVEIAERHSRQQIDYFRLFWAQIMPTR